MQWKIASQLAAVVACLLMAASPTRGAEPGVVEIVPTARRELVKWHYTFDRPTDNDWASARFDDSQWQVGRSGFGTPGTPGFVFNTRWATADIWMRREVQIPTRGVDLAALQLLVFHDEDVEIYFNGALAYRSGGFITEYEAVDILPEAQKLLKPGATIVMAVHCHQSAGGQGIDVGLARLSPDALAARRKERYRRAGLEFPGDPSIGRSLFTNQQRLACSRCHSTDGSASLAGPDLFAAGDKFTRPDLINALLEPSANIAVGYDATVVDTRSGDSFVGVVKDASDDQIGLMDGNGKLHRIATRDIVKRFTQRTSLMPQGLQESLSPQEFADLVAYLSSLRLPEVADAGRRGMPARIAELTPPVKLIPIHTNENHFDLPCWAGQIPGEPNAFLICEHQSGKVWRLTIDDHAGGESKTLWGDFRREIHPGGATGLLGLAFHPRFRENRTYYIQHELMVNGRLVARVSEKIASEDLSRDSGQPSRTIVEFPCSTDVHAGGGIAFGPDGYLYIGMGDTGPQGDPQGHGQDLRLPLGKMLRIDVDREEDGKAYAIPKDNPFRGRDGLRPEIFAYGFREPWRFSFDSVTHDLWVGDVGQDRIEEVDIVRAGENYGWNVYEGFDLFSTRRRTEGATYIAPVFAYNRRLGNSITGGYVYHNRGDAKTKSFDGVYVCADYTSKRVWGLKQTERKLASAWQLCLSPQEVSSFAQDEAGTIYLVGYQGTIYRLDFSDAAPPQGSTP